jgi:hypothetical protein
LQIFNAATATAVSISGAGAFTSDQSTLSANAIINASAATGAVSMNVGTNQTFVGGSGDNKVFISATPSAQIDGGSSGHNEIVLNNISNASLANLSGTSHFSILGVDGTTLGAFDLSSTPYTALDVLGGTGVGIITFTNVAPGTSLSIDSNENANISVQTSDSTGSADSMTLNLGTTTTYDGAYAGQLTLEDQNGNGIGTVNVSSNAYEGYSGIRALVDNALANLNVTGNTALTIETTVLDNASSLTFNNNASLGASSLSLTDNFLTQFVLGGSDMISIPTLTTTTGILTITDNDSAAVNISTLSDSVLTTASFASTSTQAGAALTIGAMVQAGLATLNLGGNVTLGISGDTVNTGIIVSGASDNALVTFSSAGATAAGATDAVTLGNGNGDDVQLGAGAPGSVQNITLGNGGGDTIATLSSGTVNIAVGNGADSVYSNQAGATLHVTAGNGSDGIYVTGAGDVVDIAVGTGANIIATGNGTSGSIVLAAHTGVDAITVGALAAPGGTPNLTSIVSLQGLNNALGDTLTFGDAATVAAGSMLQVTAANVTAAGGNTATLADWVATAVGKGSVVAQTAHAINWFQFGGNTYLVETATATDGGIVSAADTVVELTGSNYTFAHSSATAGVLHLLG